MRSAALQRCAVALHQHARDGSAGQKVVLWFLLWPFLLAAGFSVPHLEQPTWTSSPPRSRARLQPRAETRPTPT